MTIRWNETYELREQLPLQIETLLQDLGEGLCLSAPYDTAWLAQLSTRYPNHGFDMAYSWLEQHQHTDGSWGGDIIHIHDRIVCTLASLITLNTLPPNATTLLRTAKALAFLKENIHNTHQDSNDTINFSGIATSLLDQAHSLGLDTPSPDIYNNTALSHGKLARLKNRPDLWSNHSIAYSIECFRPTFDAVKNLFYSDGSIAASPAATIAVLLNSSAPIPNALTYLQNCTRADGGIPTVAPIDLFEITFSLHSLLTAQAISVSHPAVEKLVALDWKHWNPAHGQSWGATCPLQDLDDSAAGFLVLHWAGYDVQLDAFNSFEEDDHFHCHPDETDPSLSAQLRLLLAIKSQNADHPWIQKIVTYVSNHYESAAPLDKWHISPYYVYATAIPALHGLNNTLVSAYTQYILSHQHSDGGWGYYNHSTTEETAYALQALLYYHQHVYTIDPSILENAAHYLIQNYDEPLTAFWIGKCLYTPQNVVKAAILGALYSYYQIKE